MTPPPPPARNSDDERGEGQAGDPNSARLPDDRDAVLGVLSTALREAHEKVESGRVYDAENEKVRQGWVRALAYTANIYRQTVKDREDLDEIRERLDTLEANRPAESDDTDSDRFRFK